MLDWITGFIDSAGYAGIALLMLVENLFPPIPSELIMPLAGFGAARGDLSLAGAAAAGTAGSVAGALFWYGIGRWAGAERLDRFAARHGRWLTLEPADLHRATGWFQRHSGKSVLIGRLIPAVRTLISVPAGFTAMHLTRYLAYSSIGTALWTSLLAGAGYLLGERYARVAAVLDPVSTAVVVGLLGWYAWRVTTFRPRAAR